jgi:hypothetical protein
MYRKNDQHLFGLSNVRASSPAGFNPKKRMTAHENNGIQGAISKKAEPIQELPFFMSKIASRTHFKDVDQGSWQGAARRKSGAYTLVCEYFEPIRNTAMGT